MIDRADARLLAKCAVVMAACATVVISASATLGLAWRLFAHLAGL